MAYPSHVRVPITRTLALDMDGTFYPLDGWFECDRAWLVKLGTNERIELDAALDDFFGLKRADEILAEAAEQAREDEAA